MTMMTTTTQTEREWLDGHTLTKGLIKSFEILTHQPAIILLGRRDEGPDQILSGKVVLDLKSSITGRVRLRLSRKIRHGQKCFYPGELSHEPKPVDLVYNEKDIGDEYLTTDNKLSVGLHEYPFSFTIPADSPSSLEGPSNTYVIYRLKCKVERGMFAKDQITKKHVLVHRTFNADALTLQTPLITESHWEGKCAYAVEIPRKGIVYGTKIPIHFKISPLKKGVKPMRVKCQLEQKIEVQAQDFARDPGMTMRIKRETCSQVFDKTLMVDDSLELNEEGWYEFAFDLDLPNDLRKTTQTYKEPTLPDIEVKHIVHYQIGLRNPEGHLSEIQGSLSVFLFFTRLMHVEDNLVEGQPLNPDGDRNAMDIPPDYHHAQLDQLYDEVSHSGYATPMPRSGTATPRALSASNLQALIEDHDEDPDFAATGNGVTVDDEAAHEAHANMLRNRLSAIDISNAGGRDVDLPEISRSYRQPRRSPAANLSMTPAREVTAADTVGSAPLTRQNSPTHIEQLSRVPSYGTALQTPAPQGDLGAQHGSGDGVHLPTYDEDASRQNSTDDGTSGTGHVQVASSAAPVSQATAAVGWGRRTGYFRTL